MKLADIWIGFFQSTDDRVFHGGLQGICHEKQMLNLIRLSFFIIDGSGKVIGSTDIRAGGNSVFWGESDDC